MIDLPDSLLPFWAALNPHQQRAAELVVLLNAAAAPEFKRRYARRWWGMLEERAKLCAMTSADLVRWTSSLAARLDGAAGRNQKHRERIALLIGAGDDALVLDAIQQDTPILIAFCRAVSDARREEYEAAES